MKHIKTGRLIRALRKTKNMSMVEFAAKIDLTQPSLSKIENGTREVSISTLELICRECNITMSDFFKMLTENVDVTLNTADDNNSEDFTKLEEELIQLIKSMPYEQQKGLYVLLLPYKK